MKITKRILAVLVLCAVLVSGLLLTVSAEETFNAEGISNIEDVLEYFEETDFFEDTYENGLWSDYYTEDAPDSEVVADPQNSANKVMKVTGSAKDNKYSLSVSDGENVSETLVISFDFYYDLDMEGAYTVDVLMKDANGVEDITFTSFLRFDIKNGTLKSTVYDETLNNGDGAYVLVDYEDFEPVVDTWHNVVMFMNAKESTYSFKISTDGRESWHTSPEYKLSASEFSNVELKPYLEGRTEDKISFYLDNVKVYTGTIERYASKKTEIVEQTIIDLEALYLADGTDSLTKMRVATVLDKLKSEEFAFVSENEMVNAILEKATTYINLAYAGEVIKRASEIDKTASYQDRVDFVNASLAYAANMPGDDEIDAAPGFSTDPDLAAAIKSARATFAVEQAELDAIRADSSAFILKMSSYDSQNQNYDYIKEVYATAASYQAVDYTFNASVDGASGYTMTEAKAAFEALGVKHTRIEALVTAFINASDKMLGAIPNINGYNPGDEEYEDAFAALSEGYYLVKALNIAADSVKTIDLDAELDEATISDFNDRNNVYFSNESFILANMKICDSFVAIMSQATAATYYTAQVKYFNSAKEIYDNKDANGRPTLRVKAYGVVDSVADYLAIEAYIADSERNAKAYVDAVAAAVAIINSSEASFAEMRAAVDAALALKANGDINGIDGVSQANADLSKYNSYLDSVLADSNKLVELIPQIEDAETFLERRALLVIAAKAAANCETSLEGVADALARFETYKAAYEEEIAVMNAMNISATVNAFATAGAVATDDGVYEAVSVLDNYVEHINQ